MQEQVEIKKATADRWPAIISLLQSEKLPIDDLPDHLENFYVAIQNKKVIGAIGLERYCRYGLLRSMVVSKQHRNKGIASKLIDELEKQATKLQLKAIYLLTESAPAYFERKGFEKINRPDAPEQIKSSSEFSSVCPVSAVLMMKQIQSYQEKY